MGLQRQLARIAAAIVLIVGFALPSLAIAHEGRDHHAPRATQGTPPSPEMRAHSASEDARERADDTRLEQGSSARAAPALTATRDSANAAAGVVMPCGGNCCGAGMACCGAALTLESFWIPLLQASVQLGIPRAPPLPGLPPEALPKPPKSIA
jgi:hypothetical protein